jgi:hypothetical protein
MYLRSLLILAALVIAFPAHAQMRVVTYNCARLNGDVVAFQDVLDALMIDDKPGFAVAPWVVVFEEVPSSIVNTLHTRLNNAASPGASYALATYTTSVVEDGSAGAIALFYRTGKLTEIPAAHVDIPTGGNRNTDRWLLTLNDYDAPQVSFYVYGSHLKAENDPPDIADRNAAAVAIRNNANTLPVGAGIIYLGDLNFYVNTEPAYLTMTNPGNGRAIDALGNTSWAGSGNAIKHTQSPCLSCHPNLVGGGLDDRFDFIFFTDALNGSSGLGRIPGTYRTFGNDGGHYNLDINNGNNFYYPGDVARSNLLADALHDASDHLPVILDFRLPAIAHAQMPDIAAVIEDAVVTHPVTVTNLADAVTPVGADTLNFTVIGTTGFSGGASGSVGPAPDQVVIDLPIDTSAPGVITCGAIIISTGQDVQNASILLGADATVLRHAAASFSPKLLLDDALVSVRLDANTGVQNIAVPVYNLGFDDLQALLDIDAVSAAAPPLAFTGELTSDIGAAPAMLSFTFDTTSVRPGTYGDSVVIDVSDEDLAGEQFRMLALDIEVIVNPRKGEPCIGDTVSNATFAPPPDGVVDGADLAFLLGEWGPNPGSPADTVSSISFAPPPDGVVDGADLAVLLGNWGVCD